MTESEADFQRAVVDLAHIYGWRVLHVRRSIGRRGGQQAHQTTTSIKGWPDLFCWREGDFFAAELKTDDRRSKLRPEQAEVLESLRQAGIPAYVWRPRDWDEVQAVLTHGTVTN